MYSHLLLALDGSATSHLAMAHASALARLSNAKVTVLHVVDELDHSNGFERPQVYLNEVRPRFLQAGQALLDAASEELLQAGVKCETVLLENSGKRASELIAEVAAAVGADVIVLGTHGRRGLSRLLMGSDAEQVARIAPVPVLLVRHKVAETQWRAATAK